MLCICSPQIPPQQFIIMMSCFLKTFIEIQIWIGISIVHFAKLCCDQLVFYKNKPTVESYSPNFVLFCHFSTPYISHIGLYLIQWIKDESILHFLIELYSVVCIYCNYNFYCCFYPKPLSDFGPQFSTVGFMFYWSQPDVLYDQGTPPQFQHLTQTSESPNWALLKPTLQSQISQSPLPIILQNHKQLLTLTIQFSSLNL